MIFVLFSGLGTKNFGFRDQDFGIMGRRLRILGLGIIFSGLGITLGLRIKDKLRDLESGCRVSVR